MTPARDSDSIEIIGCVFLSGERSGESKDPRLQLTVSAFRTGLKVGHFRIARHWTRNDGNTDNVNHWRQADFALHPFKINPSAFADN